MKTFILRLILFSLPIIVVIVSMDLWLRNINTIYKEKTEGLYKQKDSIQVLVLGNSHANYAVDPNQFKLNTYNLANVSQSIYFDKRLALKYLNDLKNLKFIFISVDYHSLYFSSQGVRDIWSYYEHGIKYKDDNYLLPNISPFLFGYKPKASFSLLKKSVIKKWKYKGQKVIDYNVENGVNLKDSIVNGFISFDQSNDKLLTFQEIKKKSIQFNELVNESNEFHENFSDLEEFIGYIRSKRITPILFSSPIKEELFKLYDKNIKQQNQVAIKNLCQKYNLEYWDFTVLESLQQKDFYNSDHLNKIGAEKFSTILNSKILELAKFDKN